MYIICSRPIICEPHFVELIIIRANSKVNTCRCFLFRCLFHEPIFLHIFPSFFWFVFLARRDNQNRVEVISWSFFIVGSSASASAFQVCSNSRLRSSDCFSVSSKDDIIICLLWRHSSRWWWLGSTLESTTTSKSKLKLTFLTFSSIFVVFEGLLLWLQLDAECQSANLI